METKIDGTYYKIIKACGGLYAVETITVVKGKVTDVITGEASYPPIALSKFGKTAFEVAQAEFDRNETAKAQNA